MKTVIEMAREAGLPTAWISESGIVQWAQLERLIAVARADEREACAKVCDDHATKDGFEGCYANACAESIRARGNT